MKLFKYFKRNRIILYFMSLIFLILFSYGLAYEMLPNQIHIAVGEEQEIDFKVPVYATIIESETKAVFENHSNMKRPIKMTSTKSGNFVIGCKLFGILPVKDVFVNVIDREMLVPGGNLIGIYIKMQGVLVIGTGTVTGLNGLNYEPAFQLVQSGDYIESINGEGIQTKKELIEKINVYGKDKIILGIRRKEQHITVALDTIETEVGSYKIGIWVRDSLAGIGTLTYHNQQYNFGALGHGINDIDTGQLVEIEKGILYKMELLSITKGEIGMPGEIVGSISYKEDRELGTIEENTEKGIYGNTKAFAQTNGEAIPICLKQEIEIGAAQIISEIEGERKYYDIEITQVDLNSKDANKEISLEVCDARLLDLTGGIVQGMSGSPIIQKGKIVGAVTHVFVQDSTKGYGIFIENMINH